MATMKDTKQKSTVHNKPPKGKEIISHNCFGVLPHFPVSWPLIKTNRAADI